MPISALSAPKLSLVLVLGYLCKCKCLQRIQSINLGICFLCMICWLPIPMGRRCCFLGYLIASVGLWEMVLERMSVFLANLHVFPLLTGFLHSFCPEDQQVGYVDHFTSWYWDVSGFYELHSFLNLFEYVHHWVQEQPLLFHFLLTLLYVHGWYGPMIIIEVMHDSRECTVGLIYVCLALPLEVLLVWWF